MVSRLVAAFNREFGGIKSNLNCGSDNSLMCDFLSQWGDEGNCILRELAALTKVICLCLAIRTEVREFATKKICKKKFSNFLCYVLLVQRIQEVFVMEQFSLPFIIPFNNKALMM